MKQINGHEVKAFELFEIFKIYVEAFRNINFEVRSPLDAHAKFFELQAKDKAINLYDSKMSEECKPNSNYIEDELFRSKHNEIRDKIIQDVTAKMFGGESRRDVFKLNFLNF